MLTKLSDWRERVRDTEDDRSIAESMTIYKCNGVPMECLWMGLRSKPYGVV